MKEIKEKKFNKLDEKLEAFFDISEDMIFILDNRGCFSSINKLGALHLGYIPSELIGTHLLKIISKSHSEIVNDSMSELIKEKKSKIINISFRNKEEILIPYKLTLKPFINANRISGIIGLAKQTSNKEYYQDKIKELRSKLLEARRMIEIERTRAEHDKSILEEINKLKNEFISNVSHELRTPLASIIGFSETILSDPGMPTEMKIEFNQIILAEGKRLARLINDILEISKIEVGKLELNKSDFDLNILLRELADHQKTNLEFKKIHLTLDLPEMPTYLHADRERISQAVNGLITNAIKFTPEAGRILVSLRELYREIEIAVSDTGIGIPEKDLKNVFDKFYRVHRPGMEIPGTGLGLVFVKQIVDLHKGLITVQSELDKGSTFLIKLPK